MTGIIISAPPLTDLPPGTTGGSTEVLPPVSFIYAVTSVPQTWTAAQTFLPGTFLLQGSISGYTVINASNVASGSWTVQSATDTFVGRATTDTLTNKSIDGLSNTLTNLPVGALAGQVPIALGGTGQSSAAAGFDALSPTTTRGDIIARGASSNQRVALGTSGYALLSNGTDPAWTGFLRTDTGAGTRTWNSKSSDIVSVLDFSGVDPTGATDSTAGIQAAHNTNKLIYNPGGTYLVSPGITLSSAGMIGDGPTKTIFNTTDTTSANMFKYTTALGSYANVPLFRDFTLNCPPGKSGGAGIQFLPASGEASYMDIRDVHTNNLPIGLDMVAASLWKVIGCDFLAYTIAGVQVANTNNPDSGDSVIADCVFNNPYTTGSAVWMKSSGGLKIIGNKMLGGSRGITVNIEGTTSILIIHANSIEGMSTQDLAFSQGVGGMTFGKVAITGNQFSGSVAIATDASGFMQGLVISGNAMRMGVAGSNQIISLNAVTDICIDGNSITGNGGAGSSAINLASCINWKVGTNTYGNLPTPIVLSGTSAANGSITLDEQSGSSTSSTSGWVAYGPQFAGPVTSVTFPRPFLLTPSISDITITPGSTNGSAGGIPTSVSKTGFTYQALADTSGTLPTGIAAVVNWRCRGVL